jgi:hypothetical protein
VRACATEAERSTGLPADAVSHRRSLTAAREGGEPAGQIAARELEVIRIESALRRAEELTEDVAGAIEAAA